jgi:hypothetical protein
MLRHHRQKADDAFIAWANGDLAFASLLNMLLCLRASASMLTCTRMVVRKDGGKAIVFCGTGWGLNSGPQLEPCLQPFFALIIFQIESFFIFSFCLHPDSNQDTPTFASHGGWNHRCAPCLAYWLRWVSLTLCKVWPWTTILLSSWNYRHQQALCLALFLYLYIHKTYNLSK